MYFTIKKLIRTFVVLLLVGIGIQTKAQTILTAGDIAFIGWNASDPVINGGGTIANDDIAFVLLTDITTGTKIYFTDLGWVTSNFQKRPDNGCSASQGDLSSGVVEWTANSNMPTGTQVLIRCKFSPTTSSTTGSCSVSGLLSTYNVSTQYVSLSTVGEQFFAFQGTYNSSTKLFSSITMIAGVNYYAAGAWSTTLAECDLVPTQSRNPGTSGIFVIPSTDNAWVNAYYSGPTSGSVATLKTNILNTANWTFSTSSSHTGYTLPLSSGFSTGNTWTGATSNAWATATNWSAGSVPTSANDIIIPDVATDPIISTGTANCKNITINTGGNLTVTGGTFQIAGTISNSGTFTASAGGTIELNGTTSQSIPANTFASNTIANLKLNNNNGASLGGVLNITNTYTPTSGTLTTSGNFYLKSSSTATARIEAGATSGGYITGNVNVERYIPGGRRAFRFLGHPFTTAQSMSVLTDDIDITGSGGSPFTTTGSNNPSAFYFDVATGDNTTTGNNPGWTPYTASSTWAQYQTMRVLVRGAKGEGLTSAAYTPSAVTIDMSGTVNQGNQTISLTKGSGTSFVLVGNPFQSQVNMDVVSGTNIGSSFYIWNANQGTRGAYTSYTFGSSSFNLPAGGAFVTTLSANGSVVIEEADKTSGTPGTMLKTTAIANQVELMLEDSTIFWDRLLLNFDDNAMATVDYPDAAKLYNPDMTFYTLSKDDSMLSIDTRPYVASETIKLGLYADVKKNFKFTAPNVNMPAGTKLYFTDKLLSKTIEVTPAFEYWFTVDTSSASWGNNRFELNTQGEPTSIRNVNASKLKVKLVPNPTTENVTLYYEGAGKELNIVVTNMMGVKVAVAKAENVNGNITIPTAQLANGIYNVTIYNGSEVMTQKLIKQ